jgi:malate permease and related proteins
MLQTIFAIVAPVLISIGVGFGWARLHRRYNTEDAAELVLVIATPCLIFATLSTLTIELSLVGAMLVASAATIALGGIAGALILRLLGLPFRVYLPSLMHPNAGNMGLPLSYFAFGDVGLALAVAALTVNTLSQFTIGLSIASGGFSLRFLLRSPIVYAIVAAAAFLVSGTAPPQWLLNTTALLGDLAIPLMLVTLGVTLARLRVTAFGRCALLAVIRLVIGFAIGVAVAAAMGFDGAARGVLVLVSSMPVAVFNVVAAQRFANRPEEVAAMVLVSTVLSFVTLPALFWYLL